MSGIVKKVLLGGVVAAVVARAVEWVTVCNCSYEDQNFLQRSEFATVWRVINLPSYFVGAAFGPNSHLPDKFATELAFFVQWALTGSFAVLLFLLIRTLFRKSS